MLLGKVLCVEEVKIAPDRILVRRSPRSGKIDPTKDLPMPGMTGGKGTEMYNSQGPTIHQPKQRGKTEVETWACLMNTKRLKRGSHYVVRESTKNRGRVSGVYFQGIW